MNSQRREVKWHQLEVIVFLQELVAVIDSRQMLYTSGACREMVLQYVPEKLYVEMPNAAWTVHPELGPGIIGIIGHEHRSKPIHNNTRRQET